MPKTPAESLGEYAKRTGTYLYDTTMPSLQPGEYMGAGGSIISASSDTEAARQAEALKTAQTAQEKQKQAQDARVQSWLDALRAEDAAKRMRIEEKTRVSIAQPEYRPSPLKPTSGAIIFPTTLATSFEGNKGKASIPAVQGSIGAGPYFETQTREPPFETQTREPPAPLPLILPRGSSEAKAAAASAAREAVKETAAQAKSAAGYTAQMLSTQPGRAQFARTTKQELVGIGRYAKEHPVQTLVGAGVVIGAGMIAPLATTAIIGGSIAKTAITRPEKATAEAITAITLGGAMKGAKIGIGRLLPGAGPRTVTKSKIEILDLKAGLSKGVATGTTLKGGTVAVTKITPVISRLPSFGKEARFEVKAPGALEIQKIPLLGRITQAPGVKSQLESRISKLEPLEAKKATALIQSWQKPVTISRERIGVRAIVETGEKGAISGNRLFDLTGKMKIGTQITKISTIGVSKRVDRFIVKTPPTRVEKYQIFTGSREVQHPARAIISPAGLKPTGIDVATGKGISVVKTPLKFKAPWNKLKPKTLYIPRALKKTGTPSLFEAARIERETKMFSYLEQIEPSHSKQAPALLPPRILQPTSQASGLKLISKPENKALYDKPVQLEAIGSMLATGIGEAAVAQRVRLTPLAIFSRPTLKQEARQEQAQKLREREGLQGKRGFILDIPSVRNLPKTSVIPVSALIIGPREGVSYRIRPISAIKQVQEQKQEQSQAQRQRQETKTTTTRLPPFAPAIGGGFSLGGGGGGWKNISMFRIGKPKRKITPLADYLSFSTAEAKTGRKAYHQAPTFTVKSRFMAEISKRPFSWKFPVANLIKRKKKGGMKLL